MSRKSLLLVSGLWLFAACSIQSFAQSITAGDVTGTVTDATGGGVPNASVTLTNINTNVAQKQNSNAEGSFRFAFIQPGTYKIDVVANGFQAQQRTALVVTAGQPTTVNVQLAVASTSTTVNVVEGAVAIQTDNADVTTTFSGEQVQDLPNPGGDITYVAQTAPGVVMNTQAGYGNFTVNGMPGISNLFSINGQNFNDPFLGINNSGSSNLLLGQNDIAEASVITNGYSAQYGQYAGAQITYITKSGTNQFHGDAMYIWNGRIMNADQFFSNTVGEPRPFNNFNEWATGVQGPIWKNHTFFDVDYEGVHNELPTASDLNLIPSQPFQTATLTNLAQNGHADEIPFYNQLFAIYNNAPGASGAVPVPQSQGGGCQGFAILPAGVPCALQFRSTPAALFKEYQYSGRVDHNFSDKDHGYIRVWRDLGFQPTYTSPWGPTFSDQSNQPQMSGQVSETHTFGPNTINQFSGSTFYYSAVFNPVNENAALAALPTFVGISGTPFSSVGGLGEPPFPPGFFFPSGRRIFQYQVMDDFSHIKGRHTFRVGISWLHDNVSDLDFEGINPVHGGVNTTLTDFFNGGGPATTLYQAFPSAPEEGFRMNTLGGYVADDWKASDRLTISLNLRLENYSNPTCETNCFTRLATTFTGAPDPSAVSTPYSQLLVSGQHNAFPNTQAVVWEPRLGIAFKPFHNDKTVIRTGGGIFADEFPAGVLEDAAFNTPGYNNFQISTPNGTIAPGAANSLFTVAAAANQALLAQFHSNGTFNSISQTVPGFVAPSVSSFPNLMHQPVYYKWNFEIQQAVGWNSVLSVNYSGNHGSHIPIADEGLNAYCPTSVCPNGFAGLPSAPPNAALGSVLQYFSAGTSNYDGLTVSLQKKLSAGLSFGFNYTWSHALDDVSNGGISNEQYSILATNTSTSAPQNPFCIRCNYGNSDYDVRHYISANFVVTDLFRTARFRYGPNRVFGGWTLSSNIFFRTGLPFTPVDLADTAALSGYNFGLNGIVFASPLASISGTCTNAVNTPCLNPSQFAPAGALTGFGTIGRNSVYGPHFFDIDLALMKDVRITEHVVFSFGAHAYNLFNHANFDQPVADVSNPEFGYSIAAVGPPTSLLGSFIGAGSSPRFVAIKGMVRF